VSDSVSCTECGSLVPADAPGGICPACLWRLGSVGLAEQDRQPGELVSTSAASSTYRTADISQATPLVALGGPRRTPSRDLAADEAQPILRRLGNYDLLEELGRGGMGIVYRALQRGANRIVAVKLILGGSASGEENRERFQAEVQTLARLKHPGIVPVFEVGDEEGCPYFSMEFMPGGNLAQKSKHSPLAPREAAVIVEQLATAVHAAHEVGVLHRDIKPSNVLLDADGQPKLTDFGLAKRLDSDQSLTNTGSVLGTPGFMSPEQARGLRELTPAADVYSLGATLFALLSGKPPFSGHNVQDTVQRVIHDEPPRLRAKRPEIAQDLEAVCLKCLEKDPTRRYSSAQALAEDLARWRNGLSTIARPQTLPQRVLRQLRRRWHVATAACVLLVVGAAAAYGVRMRDPLVQLDAAVRRGEKITLIDNLGVAKWHRWEFGVGTGATRSDYGFEVFCAAPSYIELVPNTHHERFRFSAEFRPGRSIRSDSWAGVYIGRVEARAGAAGTVERAILVAFRDDLDKNRPRFPKGDPLEFRDVLNISTPEEIESAGSPLDSVWVREPVNERGLKFPDRPWRRLIVELDRDVLRVTFYPDVAGPPVTLGKVLFPIDKLHKLTPERRRQLVDNGHPVLAALPIEFSPRGGCGIYVHNASITFRNVTLEPLP